MDVGYGLLDGAMAYDIRTGAWGVITFDRPDMSSDGMEFA